MTAAGPSGGAETSHDPEQHDGVRRRDAAVEERIDWEHRAGPTVGEDLLSDHSFAMCLTHDVDRPYKRVQALYYALQERDPNHLRALLPGTEPNWTFDRMLAIEESFGVRSAFYFLDEQRLLRDRPLSDLLDQRNWQLFADRYSLSDPDVVDLVRRLDAGGWEVGLHGSYESYDDRTQLAREKATVEAVLGDDVRGGRQHYLNRTLPETWRHHAAIGQSYDTTLGSSTTVGFEYGDSIHRPFGDEFVAFPVTIMEVALPDPGDDFAAAWEQCERVLEDAAERGAITTVLWHPRMFNREDWPGYATLYRRLLARAQELGAWIGPPGELYDELDHEQPIAEPIWERDTDRRVREASGAVAADE